MFFMTNDTTTLNGALTELGETLADNLYSMGVVDADPSDGLTTLAGKVLDIEPSIGGLDLDTSISIHSSDSQCSKGSSIMFWAELVASYDDETVEDVDLSGVLTGATVEFKIGGTVIGSGVTDADGIAYYTHKFTAVGEYSVTASFDGTDNFDACTSSATTIIVPYDVSVTSDKSILSYADSESAVITCVLSDDNIRISGETLSYEVLDADDNILVSGSDTTDINGEIQFSYASHGVGDVYVNVYYGMIVSGTYVIEDCVKYDTTDYYALYNVNISLPNEFVITWDSMRKVHNQNSNCMLYVGADSNNMFQCGCYGSGGNNGLQEKISGSWQTASRTIDAPLAVIQYNTLTYSNGSLSYSNGSETVSTTPTVSLTKLLSIYGNTNGLVTNIKIKAL